MSQRLFGAFVVEKHSRDTLDTNLGLSSDVHLRLPLTTAPRLLFGTPETYPGERGALYLVLALTSDCSAVVDVGANHGYYTLCVSVHTKDKLPIYFFEPHPQLFAALKENVARNHLTSITGYETAIGAHDGRAKFYLNESDDLSSSLTTFFASDSQVKETEVKISSFASFVKENHLKNLLVKVDTEGAEFDFLTGAIAVKESISYLIIEVLSTANESDFLKQAAEKLEMIVYYIEDYTLHFSAKTEFTFVSPDYNWLLCRKTPDELAYQLKGTRFKVVIDP